jgi:hypothetical protein
MTSFELNAINFLRSLINFEGGILESGRSDPGWCCSEHAVVASLMFALLGIKASLCNGKLLVGPLEDNLVLDVIPHDFVILEEPIGLFDSSITAGQIEGLPTAFSKLYPFLGVALMPKNPDSDDFRKEYANSGKQIFALYSARLRKLPTESAVHWTSSTPFGLWLLDVFGSQAGLWGKAAWCAAEIYLGRSPFEFIGMKKQEIWKRVIVMPDRDELILKRLNEIH